VSQKAVFKKPRLKKPRLKKPRFKSRVSKSRVSESRVSKSRVKNSRVLKAAFTGHYKSRALQMPGVRNPIRKPRAEMPHQKCRASKTRVTEP
jgi:hypothetical protein